MAQLHQSRCLNHAAREAVARCPVCKNFFCRECITEHNGRVMCATCIQKVAIDAEKRKNDGFIKQGVGYSLSGVKVLVGLVLLWMVFYGTGQLLLLDVLLRT